MCVSRLLFVLSPCLAFTLFGSGIDSGGTKTSVGTYQNHGSIGSVTTLGTFTADHLLNHVGLIEVLYSVPTTEALDRDKDGMPNAWEEENGLIVGIDDSKLDSDGDGSSNLMEYIAGTDPQNANSVLSPTLEVQGDSSTISIQSILGRKYSLYVSNDLQEWKKWNHHAGTGGKINFTFDSTSPAALSLFGVSELPRCIFFIELSIAP